MKKALCFLLTLCVLASFFCVGAAAAGTNAASGIYALTKESAFDSTVTLTPKTAAGTTVAAGSASVDGQTVSGFYANAEKVEVTFTGAEASAQYLVLALDNDSATPTQGNITYIDQTGATNTSVTFTVYPSSLASGKTYSIYLASSASAGSVQGLTKIASFKYYAPYKLGDVDEDGNSTGRPTGNDVLFTLEASVGLRTLTGNQALASDADGDGNLTGRPTGNDVLYILEASVGLRTL